MKKIIIILFLSLQFSFAQHYELSWKTDGMINGIGIPASGILFYLESQNKKITLDEISDLNRIDVNIFDRSATYNYSKSSSDASDYLVRFTAAAPLILFLDGEMKNDRITYAAMFLENLMFSGVLSNTAKELITRYRPLVYNPDVADSKKLSADNRRSFFSGHTTTAFSSAVFLSTVFDELHPNSPYRYYVWAGSLLAASSVGYFRYSAGKHYPTDILVGAAVGSALGYLIPYFHKIKETKDNVTFTVSFPIIAISYQF